MVSSHMAEIKGGAKDLDSIKEEIRKKVVISTTANISAAGDTITLNKQTTWAKISGTITLNKHGSDVEVYYNRNKSWTTTAYVVACVLLCLTLIGPVLPWYLGNKDADEFDNAVIQTITIISNR